MFKAVTLIHNYLSGKFNYDRFGPATNFCLSAVKITQVGGLPVVKAYVGQNLDLVYRIYTKRKIYLKAFCCWEEKNIARLRKAALNTSH